MKLNINKQSLQSTATNPSAKKLFDPMIQNLFVLKAQNVLLTSECYVLIPDST